MKNKILFLLVSVSLILFISCSEEVEIIEEPFVIAFEEQDIQFNQIQDSHTIKLMLSKSPTTDGEVTIKVEENSMLYNANYTTIPEAVNGIIKLPFKANQKELKLIYISIVKPTDKVQSLNFTINNIEYENAVVQGYSNYKMSFKESSGGEFYPTIGGPNEPNQVFIDLSSKTEKIVKRDSWSLAFYSGNTFNVTINETNLAGAGAIDATDIDAVTSKDFEDLKPFVHLDKYKTDYFDDPERDFTKNAIKPIEADASKNKVYLLNLGHALSTTTPRVGSAGVAGEHLGYRKVRILQKDDGYLLQYAKLDETTHKEVFIPKSTTGYTFTYFDILKEQIVSVAPMAKDWDISFSVFTNVIINPNYSYSYAFSDFCFTNKLGGTKVYIVKTKVKDDFKKFTKADVKEELFESKRTIPGSSWRSVFRKIVTTSFYIIKDANDNIYKLQFEQLVNEKGERGHTKFIYELLK